MGYEVTVNDEVENLWLHTDGVYNAGDTATLTDVEYEGLSTGVQAMLTVVDDAVTDPVRETGTIPISEVIGLQAALDAKADA